MRELGKQLNKTIEKHNFKVNDVVLCKQNRTNKPMTYFSPNLLTITAVEGNMITAKRGDFSTTRNCSFFKKWEGESKLSESETSIKSNMPRVAAAAKVAQFHHALIEPNTLLVQPFIDEPQQIVADEQVDLNDSNEDENNPLPPLEIINNENNNGTKTTNNDDEEYESENNEENNDAQKRELRPKQNVNYNEKRTYTRRAPK